MRQWAIFGILIAAGGVARADGGSNDDGSSQDAATMGAISNGDPAAMAVSPMSIVQGNGVQLGETTSLYPVLGLETGFVSNMFYTDQDAIASGVLRVLGEVGVGSLSQTRFSNETEGAPIANQEGKEHGVFQGHADLYAAYNQYLSDNADVRDQSGVEGGLVLRGLINAEHPFFVSVLDHYERLLRPTNFESNLNTDRDINMLTLRFNYQPTGRSLGGYVYYSDTLDLFESDSQQFADRFDNTFGLRVNWQLLPLTRAYVDVSAGVFNGVGASSEKVSSYPFTALAGIMTSLAINVTLNARAGYTNGFYASGPSYSAAVGGLELGYRYSPRGRALLMYSYEHQDSINANYYRDHIIQLTVEHQIMPVWVFVRPEVRFREYDGLLPMVTASTPTRNDTILDVLAGVRYNFRDWLAATLEYSLASDQTDFMYSVNGVAQPDPSYVRQELMLGVRGAL